MRLQAKIALTDHQRQQLLDLVQKGQHKAQLIRNAQIILKSSQNWTDAQIAAAFNISKRTVIRVRQLWLKNQSVHLTPAHSLAAKPRSGAPLKFGAIEQALVIAQACTPAPQGQVRWTLQLLADQLTLTGQLETISPETVRRILKKTS